MPCLRSRYLRTKLQYKADNIYQIKSFYQVIKNFSSSRNYLLSLFYFKPYKASLNVTSFPGIMKYLKH